MFSQLITIYCQLNTTFPDKLFSITHKFKGRNFKYLLILLSSSFILIPSAICLLPPAFAQNPGQAASTITEDGIATSEAVASSMDRLWNDVLSGGLYGAIANLGIFFAIGTLIIFMVQWTREMVDGDNSKAFSEMIWPVIVIVLLTNNAQPLASVTLGLRGIINQTNETLLTTTSSSIRLQEAYQRVMLKNGSADAISSLIAQCNAIADPTQQKECLQNAQVQAEQIESDDESRSPGLFEGVQDFFNTNIFQLAVRGWLLAFGVAFQWMVEISMLLTGLLGPLAVGGSLLPVGSKAIFAWLTGMFSVGMVKLCFNIISGLVATLVLNADSTDPMIFAFAIGLIAPILSVVLAVGAGTAVLKSFSSIASLGLSSIVTGFFKK